LSHNLILDRLSIKLVIKFMSEEISTSDFTGKVILVLYKKIKSG